MSTSDEFSELSERESGAYDAFEDLFSLYFLQLPDEFQSRYEERLRQKVAALNAANRALLGRTSARRTHMLATLHEAEPDNIRAGGLGYGAEESPYGMFDEESIENQTLGYVRVLNAFAAGKFSYSDGMGRASAIATGQGE